MKEKHALHHMTWKEVEEAFRTDPVVMIPLGSMEEHGPHSLTGDFLAATEIAKRVAERTGAYYIPTVPFGCSEYFRGYPGTISLSPNTVLSLLADICQSLIEHGIKRIVFINGHAGNAPTIDQVARKIRREKGLMIASMDLWQTLPVSFKKELYGEDFDPSGHGGEPLTSVMMYLYPDDMRMDLLKQTASNEYWEGFPIKGLAKVGLEDTQVSVFLNMEDVSPEGVMGSPFAASSERGEAIVNKIVEYGAAMVDKLKKANATVG
jgi:creatinine amidohydrolase